MKYRNDVTTRDWLFSKRNRILYISSTFIQWTATTRNAWRISDNFFFFFFFVNAKHDILVTRVSLRAQGAMDRWYFKRGCQTRLSSSVAAVRGRREHELKRIQFDAFSDARPEYMLFYSRFVAVRHGPDCRSLRRFLSVRLRHLGQTTFDSGR